MNKEQLVKNIAEKTELKKKDVEAVVNGFLDEVTEALANGDSVKLINFGNFEVRSRSARKGRNPQTNQEIVIPAYKTPAWKPSKNLKELTNK